MLLLLDEILFLLLLFDYFDLLILFDLFYYFDLLLIVCLISIPILANLKLTFYIYFNGNYLIFLIPFNISFNILFYGYINAIGHLSLSNITCIDCYVDLQ